MQFFFRLYRLSVLFLPLILYFFCFKDPFHGDGISTTARAAVAIYDSGLNQIFYPSATDPGHPTLIPYLLALIWKVMGNPSLWTGHLLIAFFSVGILYRCRQLIGKEHQPTMALLLILISPLFTAQTMMILTHIPLTFFFLDTFYFYTQKRYWMAGFRAIPMVLTHLEGLFLLFGLGVLFLTEYYLRRKSCFKDDDGMARAEKVSFWDTIRKVMPVFILPMMTFMIWAFLHYQHTGWWISSPEYASHRAPATLTGFFYNIGLICWRIMDYGYFVFYGGLAFWVWRNRRFGLPFGLLAPVVLTVVLSFLVAIFLSGSIAHRYFLPIQILVIIHFWQSYQQWCSEGGNHRFPHYVIIGGIALLLIGGNFFYYPFKCIGDANLVYRNYFPLEKQIKADFPHVVWGTYAPLSNPSYMRFLDDTSGLKTFRLYEAQFDTCRYILRSNLTCEFTPSQKDSLDRHALLLKSYQRGGIWVKLYRLHDNKRYSYITLIK